MNIQNIVALIICIIITQAAGGVGTVFNVRSIPSWYKGLKKSRLNPPNWVFGPVWTGLFLLMGIALFLVWRAGEAGANVKVAMVIFAIQLVLNVLWSAIFFGLRKPGAAFVELVVLWLAILLCIVNFYPISPLAAWLLVPYILWTSFAGFLNFKVWQLN